MPRDEFTGLGWDLLSDLAPDLTEHRQTGFGISARLSTQQHSMLFLAAEKRGIARAPYVRRAVLAFAAHDLGIAWADLLSDEELAWRFGGFPREDGKRLAGQGFGPWEIAALK